GADRGGGAAPRGMAPVVDGPQVALRDLVDPVEQAALAVQQVGGVGQIRVPEDFEAFPVGGVGLLHQPLVGDDLRVDRAQQVAFGAAAEVEFGDVRQAVGRGGEVVA